MKAISSAIIAASGVLSLTASAFIGGNGDTQGAVLILGAAVSLTGLGTWVYFLRETR